MENTTPELLRQVQRFGLRIDTRRQTSGNFCTLEIGTGADYDTLQVFRAELIRLKIATGSVTQVTNSAHPDFGKLFLEISSFWWEEPTA